MATANDIIKTAQNEVGTYASAVKKCKYNTWYYGYEASGWGYDWCAVFVCWVFNKAGLYNLLPSHSASCGYMAKGFQDNGQLLTSGTYKPGDVVFFHWSNERSTLVPGTYVSDHVGIIKSVNSNGSYQTIEGNTGGSSYGAVLEQTRYASQISCVGRPKYSGSSSSSGSSGSSSTQSVPDVTYCVRTKNHGWLPTVKNLTDYAGIENDPITDVAIKVSEGSVWYQVHSKKSGWLGKITGFSTTDSSKYAGNGTEIDAIKIYYTTPSSMRNKGHVYCASYRVSPIGSTSYYANQIDTDTYNGMDGYAGALGRSMDKLQISLV